jgi:hypothetical protein
VLDPISLETIEDFAQVLERLDSADDGS